MKHPLFKYLILIVALLPISLLATGPSYVDAKIRPISVNDKGEVLCRTRFVRNDMGSLWYDSVEYGLCILSNGKVIEFTSKIIDNEWIVSNKELLDRTKNEVTEDEYINLVKHWDWIFKTNLNFDKLSKQQQRICEEYGFKENNVDKYKVDKTYLISTFEGERNINLKLKKQLALKKTHSVTDTDVKKVEIMYDFGNILLLSNVRNEYDEYDVPIGFEFDYKNPCLPNYYESYSITGVLFLPL